jgi:hypothetical protein
MSDNPFQPLPGAASEAGAGEPSVSAGEIAAAAAAAAVRGQQPATPEPTALPSEEGQYIQTEQAQPQAEPQLPNPQAVPTQVTPTQPFASDAYAQLKQIGIDLPVSPEAIAPEFADAYNLLAQKVLDTHQVATQNMTQAQVAQDQINTLQQSLSTPEGQERLILSLALSNPDNFTQTMDIVQRMQTEPEYAEAQRMRLESLARVEQAQRMERALNSTQAQTKGQQVEQRVERIAAQKGLDMNIAKQMIANKILQNEAQMGARDISFAEVDDIMQQLARATNSTSVMTPGQAQAVSQAPQTPAAAVGQTPMAQPTAPAPQAQAPAGNQNTPNNDAMDALRAAVRASATNARNSGL